MLKRNRFDVVEALIIVSKGAESGIPLLDQLMDPSANELLIYQMNHCKTTAGRTSKQLSFL
jgi:hypothetical protein